MSLVQLAKLNGHDPWAYLRDVPERLPGHPNSKRGPKALLTLADA